MNKKSLPDILLIKRFRRKHFFRAMKITTLLLFMFIFCLHAENSNSQNVSVTIHKNDVRLENVLNEMSITKMSMLTVMYRYFFQNSIYRKH